MEDDWRERVNKAMNAILFGLRVMLGEHGLKFLEKKYFGKLQIFIEDKSFKSSGRKTFSGRSMIVTT